MTKEEALDVIRSIYTTDAEKEALQTLIPELKDSKDEKENDNEGIRENLIKYLKSCRDCLPCQDMSFYDSSIAWLEKQKNSVSNAKYIEDVAHAFEDGRKKGIEENQKAAETPQWMIDFLNDILSSCIIYDDYVRRGEYQSKVLGIIKWLENQKAKTPQWIIDFLKEIRPYSINKEEYEGYAGRIEFESKILTIIKWLEGNPIQQKEQKPAEWNYPYGVNETADRLFAIAECLEMDGDCLFNGYSGTECGKFLRELARKQVEYKPAAWSEEDNKMHDAILQDLANIKAFHPKVNIQPEFDWLKSLPERFKLKPKEQEEPQVYETGDGETITYSETDGYKVCDEETGKCAKEHPVNLNEAAEEYANKEHPDEPSIGQFGTGDYEPPVDREYLREIAKDAFKAGAEWAEDHKPEIKLTGWVARDRNGEIYVYGAYPEKDSEKGIWIESNSILLYRRSFLDLKWEDEPIEVEVTIKKK